MPLEAIERGEQIVVGVNAFTNSEPSPLTAGENSIMVPSAEAEAQQIEKLKTWRSTRDEARVRLALQGVAGRCGERGQYHARLDRSSQGGRYHGRMGRRVTLGVRRVPRADRRLAQGETRSGRSRRAAWRDRARIPQARPPDQVPDRQARLDGHSNGAEQIAARATDAGIDVIYDGIRFTPAEIVERAKSGVHCIGLSILSGSHVPLTEEVLAKLRAAGLEHVPLVVGGIIPPADAARLRAAGVAAVYTPKDFEINAMLGAIVAEIEARFDHDLQVIRG